MKYEAKILVEKSFIVDANSAKEAELAMQSMMSRHNEPAKLISIIPTDIPTIEVQKII